MYANESNILIGGKSITVVNGLKSVNGPGKCSRKQLCSDLFVLAVSYSTSTLKRHFVTYILAGPIPDSPLWLIPDSTTEHLGGRLAKELYLMGYEVQIYILEVFLGRQKMGKVSWRKLSLKVWHELDRTPVDWHPWLQRAFSQNAFSWDFIVGRGFLGRFLDLWSSSEASRAFGSRASIFYRWHRRADSAGQSQDWRVRSFLASSTTEILHSNGTEEPTKSSNGDSWRYDSTSRPRTKMERGETRLWWRWFVQTRTVHACAS